MKKAARILAVLICTLSLSAQFRTGDVQGRIVDKAGKPLVRVKVTLSRPQTADAKAVTDDTGIFRFLSVFPGPDYSLRAELSEYKTVSRADVAVTVGATATIDFVLEPGKPEEQVNIKIPSPAIDRGLMTTGAHFGWTELQSLPTTRDPYAILQLVPSVTLDRENVGGNESSEPSAFVAKGDSTNGARNTWTIDGIAVTDPVLLGVSTVSYDFDTFDEISVTTGGAADATAQTGGIAVNLVTRRGGNKLGGTARVFLTHHSLQSSNLTASLQNKGVTNTSRIQYLKDYGVSAGGPIVKNRVWWWGAYGAQDLFAYTIYNLRNQTDFGNFSFKLHAAPFAGNRIEALVLTSQKERYGLNPEVAKPEGDHQRGIYSTGNPIFKIQDEQAAGNNFLLSLKFTVGKTGMTTRPMVDEKLSNPVTLDVETGAYVPFTEAYGRSWDWSSLKQKSQDFSFALTLFRDSLLGASHEFKGGLEFADRSETVESGYLQSFLVYRNFVEPMIDLGEGLVVPPAEWQHIDVSRDSRDRPRLNRDSFYLQDTISQGRFALMLGLRYDRQAPSTGAYDIRAVKAFEDSWGAVFDSTAMSAINTYLPPLSVNAVKPKYRWSTWSPRLGLSWDVSGNGRTVVKLALSQYGDVLAAGSAAVKPLGLTGSMGFWWKDEDADGRVNVEEMYWQYSSVHPDSPYELYNLFTETTSLTEEALAALEGGFESDAYLAGNYRDYDWWNAKKIDYDNLTTFYRSDVDPEAKNVKTSPRTREIMLSLERELRPNFTAAAVLTYRRSDRYDWAKPYYPADIYPETPDLVIDNTQTWYTPAGTVPDKVTIDEVEYSLKDAAGKTWYLPIASYPGQTPYTMVDKSTSYRTYLGFDLIFTKRLADRWFLNASLTLQDQRVHWGDSYIDETNKWAIDGKAFGNWSSMTDGRVDVQMYSRWLLKISALYQLPLGFDVSATLVTREGWRIPNYIVLGYAGEDAWPGLYRSNVVFLQTPTKDHLPTFRNLSFRLEKTFSLGTARMVLMADVFNLLNSATVIRAYDANIGTYYVDTEEGVANPTYRRYNEILNPRIMRLGVRFEF